MTMTMQDDLSDVVLEGRTLVSDNPDEWIIPADLRSAPSVREWWALLHERDVALPKAAVLFLKEILDNFSTDPSEANVMRRRSRTAICAERLVQMGYSIEMVMAASGRSGEELFGPSEWAAWKALEAGQSVEEVVGTIPCVTNRSVTRMWKVQNGVPIARNYLDGMEEEGLALVADGLSLRQAANVLAERWGIPVDKQAVGTWVSRARKRQREAS